MSFRGRSRGGGDSYKSRGGSGGSWRGRGSSSSRGSWSGNSARGSFNSGKSTAEPNQSEYKKPKFTDDNTQDDDMDFDDDIAWDDDDTAMDYVGNSQVSGERMKSG